MTTRRNTYYTELLDGEEPSWPRYHRRLVAQIPRLQTPWYAACRIVGKIWRETKRPERLVEERDVQLYRQSLQQLALDIEIGRAELAYERNMMS